MQLYVTFTTFLFMFVISVIIALKVMESDQKSRNIFPYLLRTSIVIITCVEISVTLLVYLNSLLTIVAVILISLFLLVFAIRDMLKIVSLDFSLNYQANSDASA